MVWCLPISSSSLFDGTDKCSANRRPEELRGNNDEQRRSWERREHNALGGIGSRRDLHPILPRNPIPGERHGHRPCAFEGRKAPAYAKSVAVYDHDFADEQRTIRMMTGIPFYMVVTERGGRRPGRLARPARTMKLHIQLLAHWAFVPGELCNFAPSSRRCAITSWRTPGLGRAVGAGGRWPVVVRTMTAEAIRNTRSEAPAILW